MNDSLPKEVIILGMHRSGTSMLSGIVERLGIDMGDDQPGRQFSNPMGHYEDGDFLTLNESILATAGGSWNNPPAADLINDQALGFGDRLEQIIRGKFQKNENQSWGWKDPRTSLTIQLYFPYLKNPYILWCQRDQAAISNSLWKRNKITPQQSERLTDHYQLMIGDFIEKHPEIPVLRVSYQDIVNRPEIWIWKIADFLEVKPDESQVANAEEFILPKKSIQKKKIILWLQYLLSLPIKALRKINLIK
jgi:hypothetical protein